MYLCLWNFAKLPSSLILILLISYHFFDCFSPSHDASGESRWICGTQMVFCVSLARWMIPNPTSLGILSLRRVPSMGQGPKSLKHRSESMRFKRNSADSNAPGCKWCLLGITLADQEAQQPGFLGIPTWHWDVLRTVHRAQTQRPLRLCPDPFRSNVLPFTRDWNQVGTLGPSLGLSIHKSRLTQRSSLLHENQSTSTPSLQHGHQPPSQFDSLKSWGKMKFRELGCACWRWDCQK